MVKIKQSVEVEYRVYVNTAIVILPSFCVHAHVRTAHVQEWAHICGSGRTYVGVGAHMQEWEHICGSGLTYVGVCTYIDRRMLIPL